MDATLKLVAVVRRKELWQRDVVAGEQSEIDADSGLIVAALAITALATKLMTRRDTGVRDVHGMW